MVQTTSSISELVSSLDTVSQDVQMTFGSLSVQQINWKPSPDQWSVAQCLDHLITTNRPYHAKLERIANGENKRTFWQSVPFLPGLFGKFLIKAVSPEAVRKLKAPAKFQPASSTIDVGITRSFVEEQKKLVDRMNATAGLDLDRILVSSPITDLVNYSVADAYRIIVNHERRHVQQAKRVMDSEGFPRT